MIRDDLSSKVIHLTRGAEYQIATDRFCLIAEQRCIQGGNTSIRGGYRCVCFSEAPISKLAYFLSLSLTPQAGGMRYKPFGIMVDKAWLFAQGGRPVIYQPEAEFDLLPESHRHRHVRYEPGVIDWTWEREWRVRTDSLALDPAATTLVVPNRRWEEWFIQRHVEHVAAASAMLEFPVDDPFPWHFIVLSDLGVDVPGVPEPP